MLNRSTSALVLALMTHGSAPDCEVDAREAFRRYARPRVAELLGAVGLDVVYERASGDYLYFTDERGRQVRVLDLLGGYGASLFGHNHPELVACAREVLAAELPFHAQASVRGRAGLLAERLSRRVGASTGREYVVTFANTGAEAVEAALKHAELEAWERARAAVESVRQNAVLARQRLEAGSAQMSADFLDRASQALGIERCANVRELADAVERRTRAAFRAPPVSLALRGAFHGKTSGALRLTHEPEYRKPWERWGSAHFVSRDDVSELDAALRDARIEYFQLTVDRHAMLTLQRRGASRISACFVEPIQGEGGIHPLAPDYLLALRDAADRVGFPLVFDEIQSGMGRTGTFLASEPCRVRGDYYLLSKSLGGGLVKIAAVLVDASRYRADFGYLHTSTFAEDDLSCSVALRALDFVDETLLRECRTKGEYLLRELRALQRRYPAQIRDVRGCGLMVGLELEPPLHSASGLLRVLAEQDLLGYFAAGYLLHEEHIRVAPGLSAHGTLRLEPSAAISQDELARTCGALERLCVALRDADVPRLCRFAVGGQMAPLHDALPRRPDRSEPQETAHGTTRIAFLVHYMRPSDLRRFESGFDAFDDGACARFIDRTRRVLEPFVAERFVVHSGAGPSVEVSVIVIPFTPAHVMAAMRERSFARELRAVRDAVELARSLGCKYVGLGGYTSIVSNNCTAIVTDEIGLTSGNALTVASAVEVLLAAAAQRGITRRRLGVVGATGNIGALIAELAASDVDELVLIGRTGNERRLAELAAQLPRPASIATDLSALRSCSLIACASNSPEPMVQPEHIADDVPVAICDLALPGDVTEQLRRARPNAHLFHGGVMRLPLGQHLERVGVEGAHGLVYACLAETLTLGFSGHTRHFSYGALQLADVHLIRELARTHGFSSQEKAP